MVDFRFNFLQLQAFRVTISSLFEGLVSENPRKDETADAECLHQKWCGTWKLLSVAATCLMATRLVAAALTEGLLGYFHFIYLISSFRCL